jgi:hypothetical protein
MKITIETNDESFEGLIESLKIIADAELAPKALEEHKHWLKTVLVSDNAGPMELIYLRFNNLDLE